MKYKLFAVKLLSKSRPGAETMVLHHLGWGALGVLRSRPVLLPAAAAPLSSDAPALLSQTVVTAVTTAPDPSVCRDRRRGPRCGRRHRLRAACVRRHPRPG